jgi:GT2 family glycosyltransferase
MSTRAHILVLNHNGQELLAECLPSVVACARASATPCRVTVVDNESTDGSEAFVRHAWPDVGWLPLKNRVLVSFNEAVRRVDEPIVLLLNNDVKLAPGCVDRLIEPFARDRCCFFTTPLCWTFDGRLEAAGNRLRFRRGLVTTTRTGRHDQHRSRCHTASGGAVMAVCREKFLRLGGFDDLYLPGRFEDLDLAFRGWLAGWTAHFVRDAIASHKGSATFAPRFNRRASRVLDARNALLFAWKNLRERSHVTRHLIFLAARLIRALACGQDEFLVGCAAAARRIPHVIRSRTRATPRVRTERDLFELLGDDHADANTNPTRERGQQLNRFSLGERSPIHAIHRNLIFGVRGLVTALDFCVRLKMKAKTSPRTPKSESGSRM